MRHAQSGFTLAELLIALALLGVIAAFTIPKVMQAAGSGETTAKVKEAVSTVEQAWYNRKLQNTYTSGTTLYANIQNDLNSITNGAAAPVWTTGTAVSPCNTYTGFVTFANGVGIAGLAGGNIAADLGNGTANSAANSNDILCIDVNSAAGPNIAGQDVFFGNFNATGDWDAATAAVFSANAANKNFFWGNSTTTVWTVAGGTHATITAAQTAGSKLQ